MQFDIEKLFSKKFTLSRNENILPDVNQWFSCEQWEDSQFLELKRDLNRQKNRLNDYDLNQWHSHTYATNPAKQVSRELKIKIRPELLTVAWTKFYECLCAYDTIPERAKLGKILNTVHLCEAPGAFVTSLNHFLKLNFNEINWNWIATTLNPYYEGNSSSPMISDDRFMKYTLNNWEFAEDYTGDLMNWDNSQVLINKIKNMGEIHLLTADGSIDCSYCPEEQESTVSSLHFCEVVTALQILSHGGSFILKIFTMYEHSTINLLFLISICFQDVNFFKPITSKPGNSEIYVICTNYKGFAMIEPFMKKLREYYGMDTFLDRAMFPYAFLPRSFLFNLFNASYLFYTHQFNTIDENILVYENINLQSHYFQWLKKIQKEISRRFFAIYHIKPISDEQKICKHLCYNEMQQSYVCKTNSQTGSFTDKINSIQSTWENKKNKAYENLENYSIMLENYPIIIKSMSLKKFDISCIYGKPIEKLHSTKFADTYIFEYYKELSEYLSQDISDTQFHKYEIKNKELIITFAKFNPFNSYEGWKVSCMKYLLKTIVNISYIDTLVLHNYDLILTQFGIGLLYLLCSLEFEQISLETNFAIRLDKMKNRSSTIIMLKTINEKETCSKAIGTNRMSMIGLVELKQLLNEQFCREIVNYNNRRLYYVLMTHLQS